VIGTKSASFFCNYPGEAGLIPTMDKHEHPGPATERFLLPDADPTSGAASDPLVRLLGHASQVEPSPLFARNVLREIRTQRAARTPWWRREPRFLLSSAVAVVAVLLVIGLGRWEFLVDREVALASAGSEPAASLESAFDPEGEMAAVEYFGQLMAVADPGDLSDEALASLLY